MALNPLENADHAKRFLLLQTLRCIGAICLLYFVAKASDLGTSNLLLSLATCSGIISAGVLLARGVKLKGSLALHGAIVAILYLGIFLTSYLLPSTKPANDFFTYRIGSHLDLILFSYCLAHISTWLFWTKQLTDTVEMFVASSLIIWLLAGHRQYQLDAPKRIGELSWYFGIAPEWLFLILGAIATTIITTYAISSHRRALFNCLNPVAKRGKLQPLASILITLLLLSCLALLANNIKQSYAQEMDRSSEGVGRDQNKEGDSNLGFHSAVGKTKQPAALVRFESDYRDNPTAPMLYFREGSLSEFNGHELVLASPDYDRDVPRIKPGEPYTTIGKNNYDDEKNRTEIVQSIFLLAEHQAPFGIDYPTSIRALGNPDPKKFLLAYQVTSLAPHVNPETLIDSASGDSSWSKLIWDHYLRAPGSKSLKRFELPATDSATPVLDEFGEDLRYAMLSKLLTEGLENDVEKTLAITRYLSQESIYTRQPNHTVPANGDAVAPYIFAQEKRGYCVHFAHAAVYLLRLASIPARIGTGYLTDLSYAKDGHILLQLGDRHAWPEVYIQGYGWAVFDIQPARAENEPTLVPDEKLLEDLMSKIDPIKANFPPGKSEASNQSLDDEIGQSLLNTKFLLITVLLLASLFVIAKGYLRFAWKFTSDPRKKVELAHRSLSLLAADLGKFRDCGETRLEFAKRLSEEEQFSLERLARAHERVKYQALETQIEITNTDALVKESLNSYERKRDRFKRALSFFSPLSFLRISKW
ncbi:transglutaminase domain-containing protein [bacterium]|nr:transglutaminase domain-containing protein [bacterium]